MKKALNVRQERFCEFIAAGESQTDAYLKAGFKVDKSVARRNAARLLTNADIQNRISELRKPQTAAAIFTKEEKLAFLAAVVRTPIGEIGPDSPLCVDFVEETVADDNRGRLRRGDHESSNEQVEPTLLRRRVKMVDKLKALELHARLTGDFAPNHHVVETNNKTLESIQERARRIASLMSIAPPECQNARQ
jgi:hypothetical protein